MVDIHPGTALPPHLIEYWTTGPGAAKIGGWGHAGDYDACIVQIQKAVTDGGKPPLPDHEIHGLCVTLHRIATGASPGHAAGETHGGGMDAAIRRAAKGN